MVCVDGSEPKSVTVCPYHRVITTYSPDEARAPRWRSKSITLLHECSKEEDIRPYFWDRIHRHVPRGLRNELYIEPTRRWRAVTRVNRC